MRNREIVKRAWIDEVGQLISFEAIPQGILFRAYESAFWNRILELMHLGYRVQ